MAKNSLTLQINSLEALEKLIGGDTQVEIDIRNNIVQAFAEKHLKSIAGSSQINNAISSVRIAVENEVKAEIKRLFGEYKSNYYLTVALNNEVKEHIRNVMKLQLHSFIEDHIKEILSDTENLKTKAFGAMRRLLVDEIMVGWKEKIAEAVKNEIETQAKGLKLTFGIKTG